MNDLLLSTRYQLHRVVQMAEGGHPCQEILQQIAVLQKELWGLRRELIRRESQVCLELLQNERSQNQQYEIMDLLTAMYQLSKLGSAGEFDDQHNT